jgi:glycosyltransferase involved in cell wall biosynthesis
MIKEPLVSIILPLYNRYQYLGTAIDTVLSQTYSNWELIIADDASNQDTKNFLQQYTNIPKVRIDYNPENLGLFSNLNKVISKCNNDYILLLCSDDYLTKNCLEINIELIKKYPQAELILSSQARIDYLGNRLPDVDYIRPNAHYDTFPQETQLLTPNQTVPLLLQYGSINGNLTGIFFKTKIFQEIGGFKETWQHAADWEWLYRVSKNYPILISKQTVVAIRVHEEQLSNVNFRNLSNSIEVAKMIKILLADPYISGLKSASYWALHIMQLHLWIAVKMAIVGKWIEAKIIAKAVNETTGLTKTCWAMLMWLPQRSFIYIKHNVLTFKGES